MCTLHSRSRASFLNCRGLSGPYPLPERIPPTLDLTDGCRGQPLLPAELHTAHRAPVSPDKWVLHQVDKPLAPEAEPSRLRSNGAGYPRAIRRCSWVPEPMGRGDTALRGLSKIVSPTSRRGMAHSQWNCLSLVH